MNDLVGVSSEWVSESASTSGLRIYWISATVCRYFIQFCSYFPRQEPKQLASHLTTHHLRRWENGKMPHRIAVFRWHNVSNFGGDSEACLVHNLSMFKVRPLFRLFVYLAVVVVTATVTRFDSIGISVGCTTSHARTNRCRGNSTK